MSSWVKRLPDFFRPSKLFLRSRKAQDSYQTHNFTIGDLNLAAARRQATIGKNYVRHNQTTERLAELRRGIVTLPPHEPWSGDYTDWIADPFNDLNWRFQFHTLRWINPYLWDALDGNKESKDEWKRILHSWASANIPPSHAEDKYAWMDMTDGNRAIQASLGAPLVDSGEQWYVELLATHRNWLLDDAKIVPGNHGLHQNIGLFVVSAVLSDDVGMQRSIERLGAQILEAFDAEGLNEEGSVAYHQLNLVWWLEARKRLQLEGFDFPSRVVERLEQAGEAMAYLLLPDGTMPQIGDGGRGKGQRGIHPLLDQVLNNEVVTPDLPLFRHFPNGFTVSRSGWGRQRPMSQESHTIIRHGVDLRRHSHNDRGSLHIYALGRRWVTDGGFHSYQQRNRDRDYTVSREAHSLVHMPEQSYDKSGNVPAQIVQHDDDLHVTEIIDQNFESAEWIRRVIYLPKLNLWIVWDRVRTSLPQPIRQQWLIDADIDVAQHDPTCLLLTDQQHQLKMQWLGDRPVVDIAKGNTDSASTRGLIGVRWKRMTNGTSVHANFHSDRAESIVVISTSNETSVVMKQQTNMKSLILGIQAASETYQLEVHATTNEIRKLYPDK